MKIKSNETDIINLISEWLAINHIVHWRINSGACTGSYKDKYEQTKKRFVRFVRFLYPKDEGYKLPDLEIFYLGTTVYAELKKPGKHKNDLGQDNFLRMIVEGGGYAVKINCLQDMINVIHDISNNYMNLMDTGYDKINRKAIFIVKKSFFFYYTDEKRSFICN